MKLRVGFVLLLLAFTACGSDTDGFAGTWTGEWVALADATDRGTSQWTVSENGAVSGTDVDPGRGTTFTVVGTLDENGRLTTISTPGDGSGPASLEGTMTLDGDDGMSGVLVWGVEPPLSYRYTFTRD
ncbi:MAG TPA: hypothetical protein VK928_02800 [Longimicrobiales bacterium]|nr:hypothetical protein [Longimicrobiales bacterium]